MPIYEADHVEYAITTGSISIVMDDGGQLPAYWAHPQLGVKFPGIALLHDWWGFDDTARRLANYFAQVGYYVIAPDLFDGGKASTPQDAMKLVEQFQKQVYPRVHEALAVLEQHHKCNTMVAAIGVGMGGSFAFEAAIERGDLEATVAYGGFPQRYLGRFEKANTPNPHPETPRRVRRDDAQGQAPHRASPGPRPHVFRRRFHRSTAPGSQPGHEGHASISGAISRRSRPA